MLNLQYNVTKCENNGTRTQDRPHVIVCEAKAKSWES